MVLGQDQHMFIVGQAQQLDAQQWPLLKIEGPLHFLFNVSLDRFTGLQPVHIQSESACRMHHLQSIIALLLEGRAQGFMTGDQVLDTAAQGLDIQGAVQAQGQGDVVGGALWFKLPDDPLPLLGERERRTFLRLSLEDWRDSVKIHPLSLQQYRQRLAFTGGQRFYGLKQLLHGGLSC